MQHWFAAKHVLKYLKGTYDFGLVYRRHTESSFVMSLDLLGYTDADWASSHFSMRSTSDIGHPSSSSTPLRCDNQNAISLAKDYVQHNKSKHIAVHYHYVRHEVKKGMIMIEHCPTSQMIANILTKGLSEARFTVLRSELVVLFQD